MIAWGNSWRQRLRLAPLRAALEVERAPERIQQKKVRWGPGISVLIPERDAPQLLWECLTALDRAISPVTEPVQVIVSASGAALSRWDRIRLQWPALVFVHNEAPLGFVGAVQRGLQQVEHDWVFLLNNDARPEKNALQALLDARRDDAFSLAARILVDDPDAALEETGFTGIAMIDSEILLFDIEPGDGDSAPRTHFYSGGGASLFRTAPLRGLCRTACDYEPGFAEDAEWGLRSWQQGWTNWFVPTSRVRHVRGASFARFFSGNERKRLRDRNMLLLELRNPMPGHSPLQLMRRVCASPARTQKELAAPLLAARVLAQRLQTRSNSTDLALLGTQALRLIERAPSCRRCALVVAPFALYPTTHGGARRTIELIDALSKTHDVLLLADEVEQWSREVVRAFKNVRVLWLVWGRGEVPAPGPSGQRNSHAHPRLRAALSEMQTRFSPELVLVEHAELLGLVDQRRPGERWISDLHDVDFEAVGTDNDDVTGRALLDRFDAILATSAEDMAVLRHPRSLLVPNGAAVDPHKWKPSRSEDLLMFVAAMRHSPNRHALARFMEEVWPLVLGARPTARLAVVSAQELPCSAPGVERWPPQLDLDALYDRATLTVNPQRAIRGSALKCIESVCAGRVCVATADAVRGFSGLTGGALRVHDSSQAMAQEIVRLLEDTSARHALERPDPQALARFRWSECFAPLHEAIYRLTHILP